MDDRDEILRKSKERYEALLRAMREVSAMAAKERQLLKEQREALAKNDRPSEPPVLKDR